ncbi:hypothetical protein FHR83_005305 [Actinoplanes campanulatus]|uniref:Uncharacterized protein n=1 Tax=Actinoplanes campanulatus TaxID=113559 RepID=A0A7W5AK74_9ACTN|nr:hypothetical protein [Actinoplanes campanulatus]
MAQPADVEQFQWHVSAGHRHGHLAIEQLLELLPAADRRRARGRRDGVVQRHGVERDADPGLTGAAGEVERERGVRPGVGAARRARRRGRQRGQPGDPGRGFGLLRGRALPRDDDQHDRGGQRPDDDCPPPAPAYRTIFPTTGPDLRTNSAMPGRPACRLPTSLP